MIFTTTHQQLVMRDAGDERRRVRQQEKHEEKVADVVVQVEDCLQGRRVPLAVRLVPNYGLAVPPVIQELFVHNVLLRNVAVGQGGVKGHQLYICICLFSTSPDTCTQQGTSIVHMYLFVLHAPQHQLA
jgi:hypothetical protein